jgi:hypothetical protein
MAADSSEQENDMEFPTSDEILMQFRKLTFNFDGALAWLTDAIAIECAHRRLDPNYGGPRAGVVPGCPGLTSADSGHPWGAHSNCSTRMFDEPVVPPIHDPVKRCPYISPSIPPMLGQFEHSIFSCFLLLSILALPNLIVGRIAFPF